MKAWIPILMFLLSLSCIDFGYDVDPFADAGLVAPPPPMMEDGGGAPEDMGADCVEGVVDPTEDGPQLRYVGLNVDQPLLVIQAGDTVTWTNADSMRHSVVAGVPGAETPVESGGFDSGEFGSGGQFAFRFCDPRTAIYFCSTHPSQMNGYRIVVE